MTVIPFPISRHHQMTLAWAAYADAALTTYAGWLWCDDDGNPDIPGHIGDAWRECVTGYMRTAPTSAPACVDWPALWRRFIEWHLSAQDEWRHAVSLALINVDGIVEHREAAQ